MLRLLFCATLAIVVAGCSGSKGILDRDANMPVGFPNHSYNEIIQLISNQPIEITGYESESALAVKSPKQSGSFSASISHKKNDSLQISISPGLGIVAVKVLITPDSIYVHDRINKELGIGTLDDMQRMLPLPTDPTSLYGAMLGLWMPESSVLWELTAEKGYYILKEPGNRRTMFIDPIFWRIARYVENDAQGVLVEERTFAEFEDYDGIYLPRRLTFRRPGDDTSASLYHRKLTINPTALAFDFNVSSSVKRVNF